GTARNQVVDNYIGLTGSGSGKLPNQDGVLLLAGAADNRIGAPGSGNVISGNKTSGVTLVNSTGNQVQANYIGTDAAGTSAQPNLGFGVGIFTAGGNLVGGAGRDEGNVISGNAGDGVGLVGDGNRVQGNTIGLNAAGTAALPNAWGVWVHGGVK